MILVAVGLVGIAVFLCAFLAYLLIGLKLRPPVVTFASLIAFSVTIIVLVVTLAIAYATFLASHSA